MKNILTSVIAIILTVSAFSRQELKKDAEVNVPAENMAVPKQMSLAGDMIRGKVLSVGSSKSFGTPVSYTTVILSVLEVYGGSAEVGKPVELVISGWLESEKKEAALFEKAMKDDKEVVVIMEK